MINNYSYQKDANVSCLFEDKEYEERKEGFMKIFKAFQKANVMYGIACSFNLFLRGIVDDFHDFDFLVDIDSIDKVEEIMKELGAKLVDIGGNGFCESLEYRHYQLGRVDVDIIAGFRIKTYNTEMLYEFCSTELDFCRIYEEKEIVIPLISAEALYLLYCMMEGWQPRRRYKRIMIGEFLEYNLRFQSIFETYLKTPLPGWIKREVRRLLR